MKNKLLLSGVLLLIFAGSFLFFSPQKESKVCFENYCFDVELATNRKEKARGLMFREEMDSDKGMLFVFREDDKHSFWMENTLIPLDIIWLNRNKEIVFISKDTQPCKEETCPLITPDTKARYVLEVNGGVADKKGLIIGNKAVFK